MPFNLKMLHPKNTNPLSIELSDDLDFIAVTYQDGEEVEMSNSLKSHIESFIANLNESGELEAFRAKEASPPATSISEQGIDNVVHATHLALKHEGIILDSDSQSILNERLEAFLYHDLNIELE
ncbi:hypothetical protein [Vibrio barjaei]|uniref:hypothetical protein n=1 Tax=Vibrio barjaei TaxID=1676683 RepID=UPI0022842C6E|nr:hypothetical protein [Vibrio barjaei]MCY9874783.1 hypothetical protein [Vibrio barjaei]